MCYNRSTANAPKQKREKLNGSSSELTKNWESGKALVPDEHLKTFKCTVALLLTLKYL